LKTYFFLILCVLFWSGNFVLGRYIKDDIEPIELAFFRWIFVFIIVLPILITRFANIYKVFKKNYLVLLLLSLLGITTYNTILYTALSLTTSTNALIINSIIPILILILSFFILKQKIVLHQTLGILVSTCGVIFLILKGNISGILLLDFNQGDLWIIVSSITWALYSVIVKFRPKELNNFEFFTTIVVLGLCLLLPFYFYQGYSLKKEIEVFQSYYLFFIYVSVFASSLSYYFWHYGIDHIGATKTGQLIHLMPIFGTTLAYIFLGERIAYYHILGAILIAIGIYMSLFYRRTIKYK
jgi:drug/metabolite transporter (DMT)-like permease